MNHRLDATLRTFKSVYYNAPDQTTHEKNYPHIQDSATNAV